MKRSEAQKHLNKMLIAVQKARSDTLEAMFGYTVPNAKSTEARVLAKLFPNDFPEFSGEFGTLDVILKYIEKGDSLQPMDFYNALYIFNKDMLNLAICIHYDWKLPELKPMLEWDEE